MYSDPKNLNPGSVFLLLDKNLMIRRSVLKNGGNNNFIRFVLDILSELRPGEPIPQGLILRYDMREMRNEIAWDYLDLAGESFEKTVSPIVRHHSINVAKFIPVSSAAYCLTSGKSLLDVSADMMNYIFEEDYHSTVAQYQRSAPDLSEHIGRLRAALPPLVPGSCYTVLNVEKKVIDAVLVEKGGMSFLDFVERQLRRLEPGKPLP